MKPARLLVAMAACGLAGAVLSPSSGASPQLTKAEARGLANRLVLKPKDVPWLTTGNVAVSWSRDKQQEACAAHTALPLATAHSAGFSSGNALFLSAAAVLPNSATAERGLAFLRTKRSNACVAAVLRHELHSVANVSVVNLPDGHAGEVRTRARFTVASVGQRGVAEVDDTIVFSRGQTLISLNVASISKPVAPQREQRVVHALMALAGRVLPSGSVPQAP